VSVKALSAADTNIPYIFNADHTSIHSTLCSTTAISVPEVPVTFTVPPTVADPADVPSQVAVRLLCLHCTEHSAQSLSITVLS